MALKYREIKHPLFYAVKGDSVSVWWIDNDDDVCCFDYIPANYPSFSIGSFESKKEAKDRASEMKDEGWEVIDNEF